LSNRAEVLLAPSPITTIETVTPVVVKDGAICGFLRASDMDSAIVRRAGESVTAEQNRQVIEMVKNAVTPLLGKEICTRYVRDGESLKAKATLDGVADGMP
jgi:hypothetical protein